MPSDAPITDLLHAFAEGEEAAVDRLLPLVYDALRAISHNHLAHERPGHTLSTTGLVHEAYLKLIGQNGVDWQGRAHFFAVASQAMRRILVDYARRRRAAKRGGDAVRLSLEEVPTLSDARADDLLALDDALTALATFDPRQARIVEYRFFGGLTIDETATVLGVSPATVKREWTVARAWLTQAMSPSAD